MIDDVRWMSPDEFNRPAKPTAKARAVHGRFSAKPDAAKRAKKLAALEIRSDKAARSIEFWSNRITDAQARLEEATAKYREIRAEIEAQK